MKKNYNLGARTVSQLSANLQPNAFVEFVSIIKNVCFNHCRVTGLTPNTVNFLLYTALVFILNYWGEMLCVVIFGAFMNPSLVNSTSAIIMSASGLMASGFLK